MLFVLGMRRTFMYKTQQTVVFTSSKRGIIDSLPGVNDEPGRKYSAIE